MTPKGNAERASSRFRGGTARAVLVADRPYVADERRDQEANAGVSHAERAQAAQLHGDVVPEALASDDSVDPSVRMSSVPSRASLACAAKASRKASILSASISRPAAARWPPSVADARHRRWRAQEVESQGSHVPTRARPSASRPISARRNPMAFNHARCCDPHHPRPMPALAGQHQPGRGGELLGELPAGSLRSIEHRPLRIAPLAVGAVQLGGDRRCPLAVRGRRRSTPASAR